MGMLSICVVGVLCFAVGFYVGIKVMCAWNSRQFKAAFPNIFS